jgi:sporulation protein YlmC with PRC-barrel domain
LFLGFTALLLTIQPSGAASNEKPARRCLSDLRAFSGLLQKSGYWLYRSGYGYDYPMDRYTPNERGTVLSGGTAEADAYWHLRPGYEVRTLMAAANVLAQRGQQTPCETLLATTRDIYKGYEADLRKADVPKPEGVPDWHSQQIAAAQFVSSNKGPFRPDQLIGTQVLNPQDQDLGSVDDVVQSPRTGKIAYLLIGRGGLFGIDEKYVPVPWEDFKATSAGTYFLVLDTTKSNLDGAPHVKKDQFSAQGDYGGPNEKVDNYWKSHLSQ